MDRLNIYFKLQSFLEVTHCQHLTLIGFKPTLPTHSDNFRFNLNSARKRLCFNVCLKRFVIAQVFNYKISTGKVPKYLKLHAILMRDLKTKVGCYVEMLSFLKKYIYIFFFNSNIHYFIEVCL